MKNEMNSVSIFLPTNVSALKMVPNVSHVPRANVVTGRLCRVGSIKLREKENAAKQLPQPVCCATDWLRNEIVFILIRKQLLPRVLGDLAKDASVVENAETEDGLHGFTMRKLEFLLSSKALSFSDAGADCDCASCGGR